jgi:hypothetical protein
LLPGVVGPFLPPEYPGEFPAVAAAQKIYAHNLARYEAYQKGLAAIRLFLVSSIEENMMATLDVQGLGFRFSVVQILEALQTRFGTMSPLDLAAARLSLSTPYVSGNDMRTFIRSQFDLHALLLENQSIVNNADKFQILLSSVSGCGQFSKVIDNYLLNHSTIVVQTFSLAGPHSSHGFSFHRHGS